MFSLLPGSPNVSAHVDRTRSVPKRSPLIDPSAGDTFPAGLRSTFLPAVAGYPHVTLPAGGYHGLPAGISFIGGPFSEAKLLGYAFAGTEQHRSHNVDHRAAIGSNGSDPYEVSFAADLGRASPGRSEPKLGELADLGGELAAGQLAPSQRADHLGTKQGIASSALCISLSNSSCRSRRNATASGSGEGS